MKWSFRLSLILLTATLPRPGHCQPAEPLRVAAAANVVVVARQIAKDFSDAHQVPVQVISGSSGTLYAQILNGAPYDLFLSADARRPDRLLSQDMARDSRAYAMGSLVYWSPNGREPCRQALTQANRVAVANPRTAPYGEAALAVLESLGLAHIPRVQAENVGQTWAFVHAGAADGGFVSESQLRLAPKPVAGCHWLIPDHLHPPIEQKMALLSSRAEAKALADWFVGDEARSRLQQSGYGSVESP